MCRAISRVAALSVLVIAASPAAADDRASCDHIGDDTIAACSRLLQRNANDFLAYSNRAIAYNRKGDHDRAIADLTQAIRLNPKLAVLYATRGLMFIAKGDYDRAIADDNQALKLDPKDASTYVNRGLAFAGKGDYGRAIADYNQAISLKPGEATTYFARGVSWWKQGNTDRALSDYNQAAGLGSKMPNLYANRCAAYNDKGDYDRAIADCNLAVQLQPDISNAYSHRGFAYGRKGDFDRALGDLNKALSLDPNYARGYGNRAAVYAMRGDADRAIADADQALRIDPNDGFVYGWRARAYFDKGQYDRAMADAGQAVRLNPGLQEARLTAERAKAALAASQNSPGPHAAPGQQAAIVPDAAHGGRQPPAQDYGFGGSANDSPGLWQSRPDQQTVRAPGPGPGPKPLAERRVALVIGNSAYRGVTPLTNPKRDATAVAEALRDTGFQSVDLVFDLDRDAMVKALRAFRDRADNADWALVYFAGHGIEINRTNYLIPVDAKLTDDRDVKAETVSYEDLLTAIGGARALRLIVLDACRNNPFKDRMRTSSASRGSLSRGLAPPPETEPGTLVVYSAKEGEVAADDVDGGGNSPFARAFVAELKVPGREVRRLFDYVRDDVIESTNKRQQPFTYGSLPGKKDFYFVAGK